MDILGSLIGGGVRFLIFRVFGSRKNFDYYTSGTTQERYNGLVAIFAILVLGAFIMYLLN